MREMEEVCKELDEVKAEMVKLKAEYQIKTEMSECLKKAHNEQLIKFQEAKLQIEKQTQELIAKSGEISEARQINEELRSSLHEKESILRHLTNANEKLRADCGERVQKLEGENKELVLAIDEATVRNKELEQKISNSNEEIAGLKRLLSVSEKKCLEAGQKAQASKELRLRENMILKLEEENMNAEEQLKWKKEQFKHLEEAHARLQEQFQLSKEEWEREKMALLQEISSLQTRLDSQTRISEGLKTKLEMCNQALAHEESKRKLLEVQVSESHTCFENVLYECQEAQSKIESLTFRRDEEIAKLRNSLGRQETLSKEMEVRIIHLEKENQELQESLKELQEAPIGNGGAPSSFTKVRNKVRGLEKVHSNCSKSLSAKESDLGSQVEKMKGNMTCYISELKCKEKQIQEVLLQLEDCQFSLEVLNEEMGVVLMVLKSEFSEAYSKVLTDLKQERRKVALLTKRLESVVLMGQEQFITEKKSENRKKMLEESSRCLDCLKEHVLQMENALKDDMTDVSEALEKANSELAEKVKEKSQIEFELQRWKSVAGSLGSSLSQETHKQIETSLLQKTLEQETESLLCTVKEQDEKIGNLKKQIAFLETTIAEKMEEIQTFKQRNEIAMLEQESMGRELEAAILAQLNAVKNFEQDKVRLLHVMKDKDHSIENLRVMALSMEQDFTSAVISYSSEVTEKQIEINALKEALNKAECLTELVIQEKNRMIAEMEKEINDLHQKLQLQQESLFLSIQQGDKLKDLLEAKKLETEKLKEPFEKEHRSLECLNKKLELENGVLLEDIMKVSLEQQDILAYLEDNCDQIGAFCYEDKKLMGVLGRILQMMKVEEVDDLNDSTRKNATMPLSLTRMKVDVSANERSPLKEVNQNFHTAGMSAR